VKLREERETWASVKKGRSRVNEPKYGTKFPESEPGHVAQQAEVEDVQAWEMIEPGRYRPRRIRGSLLGRELG
jgi:hypothetical protein